MSELDGSPDHGAESSDGECQTSATLMLPSMSAPPGETGSGEDERNKFPEQFGCPYIHQGSSRSPQSRRRRAEEAGERLQRLVEMGQRTATMDDGLILVDTEPPALLHRSSSMPQCNKPFTAEDEQAKAAAAVVEAPDPPPPPNDELEPSPLEVGGGGSAGSTAPVPSWGPFSDPKDTVIIFDWDDTLFPTWFVSEVVMPCLPPEHKWDNEAVLPSDSPFAEALAKHAQTVYALLKIAREIGRVGIVTLAQRPWVLTSAKRFLPGLKFEDVLKELDIPIIYARESLRKPMISQAKVEEGVNIFTIAKQAAMLKALKKLYGRNPWKNVISIGDSIVERDAITEVLWGHDQDSDVQPCCKTVKLLEEPSTEQLGSELTLIGMWLRSMALHGEDFDVVMDDSEEMMNRFHERFSQR
mmetsp:Transcript_82033/g.171699  ORF Transcript_82033/g.171699 Transcript_82033/m.171699 type:complete len:413 (+) Transcript_82033:120-1358(+)